MNWELISEWGPCNVRWRRHTPGAACVHELSYDLRHANSPAQRHLSAMTTNHILLDVIVESAVIGSSIGRALVVCHDLLLVQVHVCFLLTTHWQGHFLECSSVQSAALSGALPDMPPDGPPCVLPDAVGSANTIPVEVVGVILDGLPSKVLGCIDRGICIWSGTLSGMLLGILSTALSGALTSTVSGTFAGWLRVMLPGNRAGVFPGVVNAVLAGVLPDTLLSG